MLKTHRAFIRPLKGLTIERQRQMAKDALCLDVYEHGEFKRADMDERTLWLNSLRANDKAWVPDLRVLIRTPAELGRTRVTADLAVCLATICGKGAVLEEGVSGKRSDGEDWPNQLKDLIQKVHLANRSRRALMASLKKARTEKVKRSGAGIVAEWRSPAKAKALKSALVLWQSRSFANWKDARAALPGELATASLATLTRIFHPHGRDPSRKGVGGRSRK
jgi:hypothetical protein